jgi:multidrug efflux pump subunit AcrA (membrane-fusion protein)
MTQGGQPQGEGFEVTASSFRDQRVIARPAAAPARPAPARPAQRARAAGSRRRWPTRQTSGSQRALGLILAVACALTCCWYVQQIARADRDVITGSVTSTGVLELNFGTPGVVATVLARVGEHVRKGQLLATEVAPGELAVEAADKAAVAADKEQLGVQAGTAASVAADKAQLARDEAKLAADEETIALSRIVAPTAGIVTAVDAQPGQAAAPAGVRDYVGQPSPVAAPPLFSLLPESPQAGSKSGVTGSATLPVIQMRTSRSWEVLVLVPEGLAASVRPGQPVRVSVPADGLGAVPGDVQEMLATPVSTSEGDMYEAIVTVRRHWSDPPLDGMTADVTLAQRGGQ